LTHGNVSFRAARSILSTAQPFFKFNTVGFGGVRYIITVSGPGVVQAQKNGTQGVSLKVVGTTQDSQLAITAFNAHSHSSTTPLSINNIVVRSGRLGSIQGLTSADLNGPISPLQGPVNSLQFDAIGPKAQISIVSGNPALPSVNGNLGQLTVNRGIDLGPNGYIDIANDLTGTVSVATNLTLDGGQVNIGRDLSGTVNIGGNLTIDDGGQFHVARNLGGTGSPASSTSSAGTTGGSSGGSSGSSTTGTSGASSSGASSASGGSAAGTSGASGGSSAGTSSSSAAGSSGSAAAAAGGSGGIAITGNLTLDNGTLTVGGNASSITMGGNVEASQGGGIAVAGNLNSLTVNGGSAAANTGNLTLNPGGSISVGGNMTTLAVGNSVQIFTSSQIQVAGNLTSVTVGGNLQTSFGGEIHVLGDLGTLSVTGLFQGKGSNDLVVGDNLAQITLLGGGEGIQGLQVVNIVASNNIQGLDIRNGIANSSIQAGFLINGGTPGTGSNSWNIGPDGAVAPSSVDPEMSQIAVLNSTIQAGYEIMNMTIGGDVVSDRPTSPGAAPTRIVAGETLQGQYVPFGVIDSFQIIGNLINSVLAASVAPNPQTGTYDKPAGAIEVGFLGATIPYAAMSETSSNC